MQTDPEGKTKPFHRKRRIMLLFDIPSKVVMIILLLALPPHILAFLAFMGSQTVLGAVSLLSHVCLFILLCVYNKKLVPLKAAIIDEERGIPEDIGSYEALNCSKGRCSYSKEVTMPAFPELKIGRESEDVITPENEGNPESVWPLDVPGCLKDENCPRVVNPSERERAQYRLLTRSFWISVLALLSSLPLWYYWLFDYFAYSVLVIFTVVVLLEARLRLRLRDHYWTVKPYSRYHPFQYPYSNVPVSYDIGKWRYSQEPSQCKLCGKHPMNKKYHVYRVHKLADSNTDYKEYFVTCGCDRCIDRLELSD